jgi:tetratricopeptide (TPR) repeat protein
MRRKLCAAWLAVLAGCTFQPGVAQQSIVQGDMLLVKKDYRDAIGMYDRAVAADPYQHEAFLHRGLAYRGHGNYERAIADFTHAIELEPGNARAYTERARTKLAWVAAKADGDRIQLEEAFAKADPHGIAADLDRAVALDPALSDGSALLVRGAVRLMQHRDEDAQHDFERFLRHRPKVKLDLQEVIAKWKQDRPVFDQSMLDDLCKYRPVRG